MEGKFTICVSAGKPIKVVPKQLGSEPFERHLVSLVPVNAKFFINGDEVILPAMSGMGYPDTLPKINLDKVTYLIEATMLDWYRNIYKDIENKDVILVKYLRKTSNQDGCILHHFEQVYLTKVIGGCIS